MRSIKNRDIAPLCQVLYTMQDICCLEKRRAWQRERLFRITQQFTGTPGVHAPSLGMDAVFAELDGLDEEQRQRIQRYVEELREAEKIINSIPSRTMRTFVMMLYICNFSPNVIRRELNMTEYAFMRAREAIEQAENMQSVIWRERYVFGQKQKNFSKSLDSRTTSC